MISDILPPEAMAAETMGDDPTAVLLPGEAVLVGKAVESRYREFVTGRACARRALARLDEPAVPILAGPRREPLWPDGVVGSITHCRGYRAAAVARRHQIVSLGIDAETHDRLPDDVLENIAVPEELDWQAACRHDGIHWDRLLFSAKESVYKAWYPLMGTWLGFTDAVIRFSPGTGRFTARLLVPGPHADGRRLAEFPGRYLVRDGFALTAVALPAAARDEQDPQNTPQPAAG